MKKRTVKDFIALYAPEDEEKLVLIQDGISADKTFLDTFWAAHTHALAMADVQTGEMISGRCYLSWPLTDKEREAGEYSKRFAKGQIYRIKARSWKGDALYEPQWYVTEVLEEGVPCPALEEIWTEYTKPILLEDEVLGTLTMDREMSMFNGTCRWMGKDIQISLDVEIEKKASWTRVTNVMKKLLADQEAWDKSLRAMAAQKLTAQANEWLADNDQTNRDPEKDPITEDEFAHRILLTEFTVSPGGRFTAWYEDDDMFWGHVVTVNGTLKKGPVDADIQGYCADFEAHTLHMDTQTEAGEKVSVRFTGLLAHWFENVIQDNILFGMDEISVDAFFEQYKDLLGGTISYGFPACCSIEKLRERMDREHIRIFVIDSSLGLCGFVLAQEVELQCP